MGDVAAIEKTVRAPDQIEAGTLYVGLENIERGGQLAGVRAVAAGELESSKFDFTNRHILYGKLRPYLAKIALPSFAGVCSTDIVPILPNEDVDRGYLCRVLRQPALVQLATSRSVGANLPRLSPSQLATFPVPLPPIEEQRRIAAILDQADELRAKRRASLALLDSLRESIFFDMFGRDRQVPSTRLGSICHVRGGKRLPKGSPYSTIPTRWRYVRVSDFADGQLDIDGLPFVSDEDACLIARYAVDEGNVVISIAGTVGRVAVVPPAKDALLLTENAAKLTPRADGQYLPEYLAAALRQPRVQESIRSRTGQVTIGKLALFRIEELPLPIPSLAAQRRFADRMLALRASVQCATRHSQELASLFASLQQKAFGGTL